MKKEILNTIDVDRLKSILFMCSGLFLQEFLVYLLENLKSGKLNDLQKIILTEDISNSYKSLCSIAKKYETEIQKELYTNYLWQFENDSNDHLDFSTDLQALFNCAENSS